MSFNSIWIDNIAKEKKEIGKFSTHEDQSTVEKIVVVSCQGSSESVGVEDNPQTRRFQGFWLKILRTKDIRELDNLLQGNLKSGRPKHFVLFYRVG